MNTAISVVFDELRYLINGIPKFALDWQSDGSLCNPLFSYTERAGGVCAEDYLKVLSSFCADFYLFYGILLRPNVTL